MRNTQMIKESTILSYTLTKNNILKRKYQDQKKERSTTFLFNPRNITARFTR